MAERVARSVKKTGYEQDPQRIERRLANWRKWRARDPAGDVARNAEWAKKHTERRKKTKAESAARRKRGEYKRPPKDKDP